MSAPSPHAERLQSAIAAVMARLETYAPQRGRAGGAALAPITLGAPVAGSAFDALASWFALTPFEQAVVALAAAAEISPEMAALCAMAQGDAAVSSPTSLLALAAFGDMEGASHAVFSPGGSLLHWRLLAGAPSRPGSRLHLPLALPEAVAAFLIGQPVLDEALASLVEPLAPAAPLPADARLAARLAAMLGAGTTPHLTAAPGQRALGLAAAALAQAGATPYHLPLARLTPEAERSGFARLWTRDRLALGAGLIVSFEEAPGEAAQAALARLLREEPGMVVAVGAGAPGLMERMPSPLLRVPLPPAEPAEVAALLGAGLPAAAAPRLQELAGRFRLPLMMLQSCLAAARAQAPADAPPDSWLPGVAPLLRDQVREALTGLAEPVRVRLGFADLIVPAPLAADLAQIVARHRQRAVVMDRWGFREAGGGAQGMSVLFAGPSGTGKSLAAEALAQALDLELYRVDLSQIVDKYIGETEKRLARLFDAADASDAILLFDEADALFGKRTEARDSHDRYANLEVGYLLQRIERFSGIAVLTTNMPNAIDEAFQRRFAFCLHFEFPGPAQRREIWRRAVPAAAPAAGLDLDRLATLSLSGGQIRVVAVNAAVLAADAGTSLGMAHIARALTTEYAKQRRHVPAGAFAGWAL